MMTTRWVTKRMYHRLIIWETGAGPLRYEAKMWISGRIMAACITKQNAMRTKREPKRTSTNLTRTTRYPCMTQTTSLPMQMSPMCLRLFIRTLIERARSKVNWDRPKKTWSCLGNWVRLSWQASSQIHRVIPTMANRAHKVHSSRDGMSHSLTLRINNNEAITTEVTQQTQGSMVSAEK